MNRDNENAAARNRRVVGVLDLVLELEPALRGAYLDNLGRQNPELQQKVVAHLRLLGGHQPDEETTAAAPRLASLDMPERVGSYRILYEIGRGGMSRVYLAERADDQFARQVALKVIDQGLEAPIVHQRFLAERQILASFDCPGIAKLYDGGTLPNGRPYLVMELVHGVPADQFCAEKQLDLRARLALFRKICGAVSYAHQHLVVHRDLKPSNILVKADGEPKLLDFGIAKLLDPEAWQLPPGDATRTRFRPMTPSHASPEQLLGEPIGTATDVYALGVVLFQLLTGALPHPHADRVQRVVRERQGDAAPPKASGSLEAAIAEPNWPGQDLGRLEKQLRGDLDNIVAQALAPHPVDRYASVAELDEDLRRYLAGEPVRATRQTPLYLAGKFVGRYRLPVTLAALALFLLAAVALVAGCRAREVAAERDRARDARGFLAGLVGPTAARPHRPSGISLQELLDDKKAQLEEQPFGDPQAQAEMLELLADAYGSLELDDQAQDLYTRALAAGSEENDRAGLLFKLGRAGLACGRLDSALGAFSSASTAATLKGWPAQARNSLALAETLTRAGDFARATAYLHHALSIIGEIRGSPGDDLLADALRQRLLLLASTSADAAALRQAADQLRRAAGRRPAPEPGDAEAWASGAWAAGDAEEALAAVRFLAAREREAEAGGATRAKVAALSAEALLRAGRSAEAEGASALAVAAARQHLARSPLSPASRYQLGQAQVLRAEALLWLGRTPEAAAELEAAIALLQPLAAETRILIGVKDALARAQLLAGRREEARSLVAQLLGQGWRGAALLRQAGEQRILPDALPRPMAIDPLPATISKRLESLPPAPPSGG